MTTIQFHLDRRNGTIRALTTDGTALSAVHPRKNELRPDLAFRALDEALRTASLFEPNPAHPRERVRLRLALYNPFSADVAYQAVPDTLTFSTGAPLDLDPTGTPGVVDLSDDIPTLHINGRVLPAVVRTPQDITQAVLAQA